MMKKIVVSTMILMLSSPAFSGESPAQWCTRHPGRIEDAKITSIFAGDGLIRIQTDKQRIAGQKAAQYEWDDDWYEIYWGPDSSFSEMAKIASLALQLQLDTLLCIDDRSKVVGIQIQKRPQ